MNLCGPSVGLVGRAHIGRRRVSQSKGLEVVWKDEVSRFQDAPASLGACRWLGQIAEYYDLLALLFVGWVQGNKCCPQTTAHSPSLPTLCPRGQQCL